ncbi:MAG: porin family protein [Gammaproteobacteria bacterium]|nr:porin family protein [Gammaproteobacteria bacterium]
MKRKFAPLTFALVLGAAPVLAAAADFWAGPYLGGQIGLNEADASHLSSETAVTGGVLGGYNLAVPIGGPYSPMILGGSVFAEFNGQVTHSPRDVNFGSNAYGFDFLAGLPLGVQRLWLPYVKVGFGNVDATGDLGGSDTSARIGLGAEYHWTPHMSLSAQWMHQDADRITNDNFTVGVRYHFGGG